MLQISQGALGYGGRVLFEGLDWLVTPQDRIGIVGANGSGKSTLLKVCAGIETLDQGRITRQKGLRIGYLPQDGLTLSGRTVFEECLTVFDEIIALEREQEELGEKMSTLDPAEDEYQTVIDRYQYVLDRHEALDGYSKEAQVGTVLSGLAFPKEEWERRTEQFSGGWQMRIALAKLLLEKPNLLLLDEPTNHLDLEARNWLEEYLADYPFAFALVSHDRFFLDTTVKKIIEVWNRAAHFYTGNYEKYLQQKQLHIDQLQAAHDNQQIRIAQLERFINRFRYKASKARQVQSRVKELEKIERIEVPQQEETIHFKFPQPKASGRVVIECTGIAKSYGSKEVFRNATFNIEKGDRIALVGVNGAGKSTLIRILEGSESLTGGTRKVGHNVGIDYFAQDQYKELDPEAQVLDDLARFAPGFDDSVLRGLLGCFLFSGDDVYKPIGVLSGGERNRYALARMLVRPSNFLLLDEPTNHLDMRAKQVLLDALLAFAGTVVFVSHDRYFIDQLATKVFAVGEGEIRVYHGNYEDYLWQSGRVEESASATAREQTVETVQAAIALAKSKDNNGASPERKRMNPQRAQQLLDRIRDLEAETAELEEQIAKLEPELNAAFKDHAESGRLLGEIESRRDRIAQCEKEWEDLSTRLEEA